MFTKKALFHLIVPLVIESFLGTTIGFVGTIMVSSAGEAAVSGVSSVDNINNLVMFFIAALATGGAIIIAQYLGKGAPEEARTTAKQLLYTTVITAAVIMTIALAGGRFLLTVIFGNMEPRVMQYARTYFVITAVSYPFLAITQSISAVFRSMGISKTPMFVSLLMSMVNMTVCAVLIYVFRMGVAGAATGVLVARITASAAMLILIGNRHNIVYLSRIFELKLKPGTIKRILKVGVPSGLDSGMFHLGRLILQSLIVTFGTASIAANAVVGQIMNMVQIPATAISMAIITVIGQCVGAGDCRQAGINAKRLVKLSYMATATLCAVAFLFSETLFRLFNLSAEATELSRTVIMYTAIFSGLLHPLSFTLPNVLRAAGDVRFTMIVSLASMWLVRISMSYVISRTFQLGLMSVWIAMYADWFVRSAFFLWRFVSGKWRAKQVV